jgi:hypothetical protein
MMTSFPFGKDAEEAIPEKTTLDFPTTKTHCISGLISQPH